MRTIEYNRKAAVEYAKRWAYDRNPKYYDFSEIGGDCTNFISQCLYAGCHIQNYSRFYGWYYNNLNDRSPSWTSAHYLHRFLTTNTDVSLYGVETEPFSPDIQEGDIIQLRFADKDIYTHSLLVIDPINMTVATHTFDAYDRPVTTYNYKDIRFIHILYARQK